MDRSSTPWTIHEGATVHAADGDKVGKVIATQGNYIVVEKGFFFPSDYYIPSSAIASVDKEDVWLNVSKDAALNTDWSRQPADFAWTDTTTTAGTLGTAATTGTTADYAGYTDRDQTTVSDTDTVRVPVREERLEATTRPEQEGTVKVSKDVVTETETVNVPVTEERVRVSYRDAADAGTIADTGEAFKEETIEVPVRRETVDVNKRVETVGEVDIQKEAEQRTERVSDEVRRERVRVDDPQNVAVGDETVETRRKTNR